MCGIVGFYTDKIGQVVDVAELEKAVDAINHRGPDESGIYIDGESGIGLGHTRLSIIDLSPTGSQPMYDDDQSTVIVFNGEIYNFVELASELSHLGVSFRGSSDTEVLLHLYRKYGVEMLSRLNGIFAFAIWDKSKKELFVARDAMGVKPFYYCKGEHGFSFSSEIKALSQLNQDLGSLDFSAINQYLSFIWSPGERTPFSKVKKLSPGSALVVKESKIVKSWNWYELPVKGVLKHITANEDSLAEKTTNYLRCAVHRQLVSDVKIGAFLSGGLDSSAVVAMARERIPDIQCFTIDGANANEEGMPDDLPYATQVAKHLNVPLSVVCVDAEQMLMDLEEMIYQLDEPLADPAALNVMYISRLAQENGIKVLLSGAGGDDLFTGYRRHYALMLERWWSWLPIGVRSGVSKYTSSLNRSSPLGRRLAKMFDGAEKDEKERLVNYFKWINPSDLDSLYTDNFKRVIGESRAEEPILDFLDQMSPSCSRLDRMLAIEQRFFLPEHNLTYTDKMGMAVGVEVRVPFLDMDLIEFAAQIPDHLKQKGNCGKWILKKAMEPHLPHEVIYRSKSGFGAPLRTWIKNELSSRVRDLLGSQRFQERGLFEPKAIESLIERNEKGQVDATYTIFSLMCVEIWCRCFLDCN